MKSSVCDTIMHCENANLGIDRLKSSKNFSSADSDGGIPS